MFQINAKTDHGLLIMLELARAEGQVVPLGPLAKNLGVSSSYLSQIAKLLLAGGLIKSREGVGGGYYLARSAKEISVLELIEALSGEMVTRCRCSGKTCSHSGNCHLESVWPQLLNDIKKSLAKRSLASLL